MPGQLCGDQNGPKLKTGKLRTSKAYCEGRKHQQDGGLVGDNPHAVGSEANEAWDQGFDDAFAVLPKGCCAS